MDSSRVDAFIRQEMASSGLSYEDSKKRVLMVMESLREGATFMNDTYTVIVRGAGTPLIHISVRRNDRGTDIPWRDLQCIKNDVLGTEMEAVELFPAESRLVDTANQRHLWAFAPGTPIGDHGFPFGFSTRMVISEPDPETGSVQQPIK
jgi:hypothetical protein